jgi:CBS domain-containing protein
MLAEQMLVRARDRLVTIGAGASVKEAASLMSKPHADLVVVCDHENRLVGVLTKTDIVRQMGHCGGSSCTAIVDTIMVRRVTFCRPNDMLQDVWSVMKDRGLQRLPMLNEGREPIGIVYARDALQHLLGASESDEALLRDYVMGVGYW